MNVLKILPTIFFRFTGQDKMNVDVVVVSPSPALAILRWFWRRFAGVVMKSFTDLCVVPKRRRSAMTDIQQKSPTVEKQKTHIPHQWWLQTSSCRMIDRNCSINKFERMYKFKKSLKEESTTDYFTKIKL